MYIDEQEIKVCASRPLYGASRFGKIFRLDKKREVAQTEKQGYFYTRTCIDGKVKNSRVHILVAEAWVENPNPEIFLQVNHKNGIKTDNRAENLEWCSSSQNQRHAIKSNLRGRGDQLYNTSFNEKQAHEICSLLLQGLTPKSIAEMYDVSADCIRKIRSGDTWFHVRRKYPINHLYKNTFSANTVKWVCYKIVEGFSDKAIRDLSNNKNLTIIEVKRIREKIRFKEISDLVF